MTTSTADERRSLRVWAVATLAAAPWLVDLVLFVTVATTNTLVISAAREEDATRTPGLFAYSLGLAVAAAVFLRRYWPLGTLVLSVGLIYIYYAMNYPAFSAAAPLAVAVYSAVVAGRTAWTVTIVAVLVIWGLSWQSIGEGTPVVDILGSGTLADVALFAALILLGEAVRNRRAWSEEVRLRLKRAAEDREREAARRVERERLRIARDLHDVMAHTISAINVQAGMAAEVIHDAPDEAATALRAIRKEAREAVAELKVTVGVLRGSSDTAPRSPAPGLDRLDSLIENATVSGLRVRMGTRGEVRALPGAVELTAYRILQESLTNVVRHAHASTVTITVAYEPEALTVEVVDDGGSEVDGSCEVDGSNAPHAGFGLIGMRERVVALDGKLETGTTPAGGFRVFARLPSWEAAA